MASKAGKSLMRSLGEFFGHVAKGVKTDPAAGRQSRAGAGAAPQVVRQTTEEETRNTPEGKVTLRRTTIEEIVVHKPEPQ